MTERETIGFLRKPRHSSGLLRSLPVERGWANLKAHGVVIACGLVFLLDGCGPVAPRFRSDGSRGASEPRQRPAAGTTTDSIAANRDDVETSSKDAENVVSGARSFKTEKNEAISNLDQAKMMREISKMMGVSYKLGGVDDEGIDCSAYTMNVFKNSLGVQIPRNSAEQSKLGRSVEYDDLKFGDLVFFNTTGESASHVGIYLGDDLFAHASVSLGVTISSLESFYYKKRFEGARRIVE
jgi:cell wall-associated NlpC family hydrolase